MLSYLLATSNIFRVLTVLGMRVLPQLPALHSHPNRVLGLHAVCSCEGQRSPHLPAADRLLLHLRHPALRREALYYTSGGSVPFPRLQAVNALSIRSNPAAAAVPSTSGAGFLFNDVVVSNSPPV
jgi:hypothetical protein